MTVPPSVGIKFLNTVTTNFGGAFYGSENYRLH